MIIILLRDIAKSLLYVILLFDRPSII